MTSLNYFNDSDFLLQFFALLRVLNVINEIRSQKNMSH